MSYQQPANALVVDFDLTGGDYLAPLDALAIDFELLQYVGPAYPVPPAIMVSSSLTAVAASKTLRARKTQAFGTAAQREIMRTLGAGRAANQHFDQSPQRWDTTQKRDDKHPPQRWDDATPLELKASPNDWDTVPVKDAANDGSTQPWESPSVVASGRTASSFNVPPAHDVENTSPHSDSARYFDPIDQSPYYRPTKWQSVDFDLTEEYRPPGALVADFNLEPLFVPTVTPTRPVDSALDVAGWATNLPADIRIKHPWDIKPRKGTEVDWDYGAEPNPDPTDPPDQPDIKESYVFMNASSLKKMPEGTPLDFQGLVIRLDLDSFSWEVSFTILNTQSMDLIRPGASGPAEVEAIVNGHTWRFMVEQYSLVKTLPKETYSVTGTSLTQLLGGPYSAPMSD